MKRLRILVPLLLALALVIGAAAPAMAWQGASTDVGIEVSQVPCGGGSVDLTITETDDSDPYSAGFTSVAVDLYQDGILIESLTSSSSGFTGDIVGASKLTPGETWMWTRSFVVTSTTTFVVIGRGETDDHIVLTYYDDPSTVGHDEDEREEVTVTVDPCGGGEGHTPGYWKNHLDMWEVYSPGPISEGGDGFDAVFGVDVFGPNFSLEDAVRAKGGGLNALARHAVAALLSAAHANVDYPMTVAQVIAAVQAVDLEDRGAVSALKNVFDEYNNLGADMSS